MSRTTVMECFSHYFLFLFYLYSSILGICGRKLFDTKYSQNAQNGMLSYLKLGMEYAVSILCRVCRFTVCMELPR